MAPSTAPLGIELGPPKSDHLSQVAMARFCSGRGSECEMGFLEVKDPFRRFPFVKDPFQVVSVLLVSS